MNRKISFTLKDEFPDLNYLFPMINGMIIQGNQPDVSLKPIPKTNEYYLRIKIRRYNHSFIKIKRDLETVSDEVFRQVALLCDDDIICFKTDLDGKHIYVYVLEDYMSFPKISMPVIPKLEYEFPENNKCKIYKTVKLSSKFSQLENLAKIYNLLFYQGYFVSLRLRGEALEIFAMANPQDHRASLTIGFNINLASSSFNKKDVSRFNQLSAQGFKHALFSVYNFKNSGPVLECKAF